MCRGQERAGRPEQETRAAEAGCICMTLTRMTRVWSGRVDDVFWYSFVWFL
jgi:hypothetical protein